MSARHCVAVLLISLAGGDIVYMSKKFPVSLCQHTQFTRESQVQNMWFLLRDDDELKLQAHYV